MEKKKMKLWKKLLLILLILVILIITHTTRNFIILTRLANKFKDYENKTNYIAEIHSLQYEDVIITKSYNKDENYLTTIQHVSGNIGDAKQLTIYKHNNEELGIIKIGNNPKIALLNSNIVGGSVNVANTLYLFNSDEYNIVSRIVRAFSTIITTDNLNNTKCYFIEQLGGWKIWINKDTGLTMKETNGEIVSNLYYNFDIVTDEDISKPDISDCEIRDNNQ